MLPDSRAYLAQHDVENKIVQAVRAVMKDRPADPVKAIGEWLLRASSASSLSTLTWNIAAINNNPFEYWMTHPDPDYDTLMNDVQNFVETPGDLDSLVGDVFTQQMFEELSVLMDEQGWEAAETASAAYADLAKRNIISGFMKDADLGSKRLMSMPDRMTNTIDLADGGVACRPTVISCHDGDMSSIASWWSAWKEFHFVAPLSLPGKKGAPPSSKKPCELLTKIPRAKYPALSEEEEAMSLRLQTICLAIFDAILVHMLNTLSPGGKWIEMKRSIIDALLHKKDAKTAGVLQVSSSRHIVHRGPGSSRRRQFLSQACPLDLPRPTPSTAHFIMALACLLRFLHRATLSPCVPFLFPVRDARALQSVYGETDVIFLQEVRTTMAVAATLSESYICAAPNPPSKADQNSIILLRKSRFDASSVEDVTSDARALFPTDGAAKISDGDLLVIKVLDASGKKFLLASFHGDTDGLATAPTLACVHSYAATLPDHTLIFGLDANTYAKAKPGKQAASADFLKDVAAKGLAASCGELAPAMTTFNARTYLQPQLQKACKASEKKSKGDYNPKDYIIFAPGGGLEVQSIGVDNTGKRTHEVEMVIPTLEWPSDHSLVHAVFNLKS